MTADLRLLSASREVLATPEDIREALSFQAREGVLDLFTWEDIDARFHPGEPPLILTQCARNDHSRGVVGPSYFFKLSAKKFTVRVQASAASAAR